MNTKFLDLRLKLWNKRTLQIQGRVLSILLLFIVLTVPALLKPDQIPLPACYFKQLTGYSCPTCGITHAFYDTSHLQFKSAFQHHLIGPLLYLALLLILLKLLIESIFKWEIGFRIPPGAFKYSIILIAIVWFGYWMVRFFSEVQVG